MLLFGPESLEVAFRDGGTGAMLGCIVDICATSDVTAAMGVLTSQVDLVRITRPIGMHGYILPMADPEP
jgi:hypothetical protein